MLSALCVFSRHSLSSGPKQVCALCGKKDMRKQVFRGSLKSRITYKGYE